MPQRWCERFEEPPPPAKKKKESTEPEKLPLTRISAAIYCERDGQKAILIGKGGSKLKAIGQSARKEIESLLGTRVYLELFVVVEENWRESARISRDAGLAQAVGRDRQPECGDRERR